MKRIWFIAAFTLAQIMIFGSCYDDKGNYDYQTIDEIKVTFPGSTGKDGNVIYAQKIGEQLVIHPEIAYPDMENLSFTWEKYKDNRSKETVLLKHAKDLELALEPGDEDAVFKWNVGTYSFRFTIKDTVTGQELQRLVKVVVRSTTPIGVYVLHGNESESDLATIENSDFMEGLEEPLLTLDYYSSKNSQKLQGAGRGIIWLYSGVPGLLVVTDRDGKYINTTTFENIGDLGEICEADAEKNIQRMGFDGSGGMVYVYTREQIYTLSLGDEGPEYTRWKSFASQKEFNAWDPVPGYFFSDFGFMDNSVCWTSLAYSRAQHSFMLIDYYYSPYLPALCGDDPYNPKFNPQTVMADMSLIGIDYGRDYPDSYYTQDQWAIARKDNGQAIVVLRFNQEGESLEKATCDIQTTLANVQLHPELLAMNCFQMSQDVDGLGYFSTPEGVYSLDVVNGLSGETEPLFTPDNPGEEIQKIKLLKYNDSSLVEEEETLNATFTERLGLSLYVSTWDGTQGRLYRLFLNGEGGIDNTHETEIYEGFNEIRDICFRLQ